MGSGLAAVIMSGGGGKTAVEQLVARGREAITRDTVDKLLQARSIERIIVATDSMRLRRLLADKPVTVDVDSPGRAFHFGRRLMDLVDDHHIERCLYIGGGSGPLLSALQWEQIAAALGTLEDTVITNNFYSTDFAGWTPADALARTTLPDSDNELTWTLRFDAGLAVRSLPRMAATQLDVDTPVDLMTLSLQPGCGTHLREYMSVLTGAADQASLMGDRHRTPHDVATDQIRDAFQTLERTLEQVLDVLLNRQAEILIAGRVSTAASVYLQTEALCRKRILAEERSMRASGRQARGEVNSLLGIILDDRGAEGFFDALSRVGQAVILDSRVIMAHLQSWPSAQDRFYSDLRLSDGIEDPFLRRFTLAAAEATIPVILGGHSLVSGGLWALVDAAWSRLGEDVPRRSGSASRAGGAGWLDGIWGALASGQSG